MARNKSKRDMSMVVAVGEIEGHVIEVLKIPFSEPERFEWRAVKDDVITHISMGFVMSIPEAIDQAIVHFYPETAQVEFTEPTEKDYEAINALLYASGLSDDIKSMEDAVELFTGFGRAAGAIEKVKDKAASDLEAIEDILASSDRVPPEAIQNLRSISGVFQSQCDVLLMITERNMETLQAFITNFMQ